MDLRILKNEGMRLLLMALLLSLCPSHVLADDDCFLYSDTEKTIICGVSMYGLGYVKNEESLTIPAQVVKVCSGSLASVKEDLSDLSIAEGGNPEFEDGLFGKDGDENPVVSESLTNIQVFGTEMTFERIKLLLKSLGGRGQLQKILIEGIRDYEGEGISDLNDILTEDVRVTIPAVLVGDQTFGDAKVFGRFTMGGLELVTFCGKQIFIDADDGSNCLFYIPTAIKKDETDGEKKLFIQRVKYIVPDEGVLLHPVRESSQYVELQRIMEDDIQGTRYDQDVASYQSNMLVGVTEPTPIGKTEEKDGVTYTNMVLYNGAFYPTSGGILGANRAYLQIKSEDVSGLAKLAMVEEQEKEDEGLEPGDEPFGPGEDPLDTDNGSLETTAIDSFLSRDSQGDVWFSVSGQRFERCPLQPGVYICKGKKIKK